MSRNEKICWLFRYTLAKHLNPAKADVGDCIARQVRTPEMRSPSPFGPWQLSHAWTRTLKSPTSATCFPRSRSCSGTECEEKKRHEDSRSTCATASISSSFNPLAIGCMSAFWRWPEAKAAVARLDTVAMSVPPGKGALPSEAPSNPWQRAQATAPLCGSLRHNLDRQPVIYSRSIYFGVPLCGGPRSSRR